VEGSCEHCNNTSGAIKIGEFPHQFSVLLASQELCSVMLGV
jgi:hypothetical protein